MIFLVKKIEIVEQEGHHCVHCVIEVSCDQRNWWPIHHFSNGVGEVVEWAIKASDIEQ